MLKAVSIVFSGNIIGKIFGVVRELLLAAMFGTTAPVGAYRVAQTATLIPVNFFTADSLNAGFIPLYKKYSKQNAIRAEALYWAVKVLLMLLSLFVAGLLFWSAPWWVGVLAPGFNPDTAKTAVDFVKVMAVGVPFYVIGALFSYLEIANEGYILFSARASMQSVGLIAGTVLAYKVGNPVFLAWGFTATYIVFSCVGCWFLIRKKLLKWPKPYLLTEARQVIKPFWQTVRPLLFLPIMLQGNIVVEKAVASLLGVGVVASIDYAKLVTETGITLLAVPLGLVGLSTLSALPVDAAKDKLKQIIPLILIFAVPISAFLCANNLIIVKLLFERGAFDNNSVQLTRSILLGLAVGFWAQVAGYVMLKALNAFMRNREVLIYMGVSLGINILVNVLFYQVVGPLILGLSASLYAVALFILALRSLHLSKIVLPYLMTLGLGSMIYIPVALIIPSGGWFDLFVSIMLFFVFWVVYIAAIPLLRNSAVPLVKRLQDQFL